MNLKEIVSKMSKLYLGRLVDSFLKDVPKDNESKMREFILKNKEEFSDYDRIKNKLNFINEDRDIALLNSIILHILLDENNYCIKDDELINRVKQKEKDIIEYSKQNDAFKFSNLDSIKIYKRVLEAAWKWQDSISSHEQNILNVLKDELELSEYEHRILESKLGYFPQPGNKIHSYNKIKDSLKNLQYRGLVARIKDDFQYYVIPEEIAKIIRNILGIELRNDSYNLLLQKIKKDQLVNILRVNKLPVSGTKPEMCDRINNAQIKPSKALNVLTSDQLSEILRTLEDVNITGTKEEKIKNIIDFYNKLITYSVDSEDRRELYYNYIVELAHRDYEQLRGNNVINKELEIEHFFEDATRYLFEVLLGHPPTKMAGNDNPDGRIVFNDREVILWDNKSCESEYNLPDAHFNQFNRYINDEEKRVTLFLVIAPSFNEDSVIKAQRLKAKSKNDSDVGLITAEEIKFVAENWKEFCKSDSQFNLQVFNYTGRLNKETLKQRMEWCLG